MVREFGEEGGGVRGWYPVLLREWKERLTQDVVLKPWIPKITTPPVTQELSGFSPLSCPPNSPTVYSLIAFLSPIPSSAFALLHTSSFIIHPWQSFPPNSPTVFSPKALPLPRPRQPVKGVLTEMKGIEGMDDAGRLGNSVTTPDDILQGSIRIRI
jgi:hypothetical protein